jgi:hypothetical protein
MGDKLGVRPTDPIMAKLGDDEPVFVLRGQDISAPSVVLEWITRNFDTCPEHKLREAFEQALLMRGYPLKKTAD